MATTQRVFRTLAEQEARKAADTRRFHAKLSDAQKAVLASDRARALAAKAERQAKIEGLKP